MIWHGSIIIKLLPAAFSVNYFSQIDINTYAGGIDCWCSDYGSYRLYAKSRGSTCSDRRDWMCDVRRMRGPVRPRM